jgi:hypothetical protein
MKTDKDKDYTKRDPLAFAQGAFKGILSHLPPGVQVRRGGNTFAIGARFPWLCFASAMSRGSSRISEIYSNAEYYYRRGSESVVLYLPAPSAAGVSTINASAAVGGGMHEAGHGICDCANDPMPTLQEFKNKVGKHIRADVNYMKAEIFKWTNVYADIRLENGMAKLFPLTKVRFFAIQKWIHTLESKGRGKTFAGDFLMALRDKGKGWVNEESEAVYQEYSQDARDLVDEMEEYIKMVLPKTTDWTTTAHTPLLAAILTINKLHDMKQEQEKEQEKEQQEQSQQEQSQQEQSQPDDQSQGSGDSQGEGQSSQQECDQSQGGQGGQESGGQESGGQESGDQESGDQESGGQESGDQESGGQESGDQESGGQGDQESGGQGDQESGGQAQGGQGGLDDLLNSNRGDLMDTAKKSLSDLSNDRLSDGMRDLLNEKVDEALEEVEKYLQGDKDALSDLTQMEKLIYIHALEMIKDALESGDDEALEEALKKLLQQQGEGEEKGTEAGKEETQWIDIDSLLDGQGEVLDPSSAMKKDFKAQEALLDHKVYVPNGIPMIRSKVNPRIR